MTPNNLQYKIGIVDDHNLFRKGLIKLINLGDPESKYTIIFEAENGNDLKDKMNSKKPLPDIILMDIDMPGMDGYEAVEWLRKQHREISILIVSMYETEEAILKMIRMGVKGYLSKDIEVEDMHAALSAIAGGKFYYSELVSNVMAQTIQNTSSEGKVRSGKTTDLSDTELEFIKLACTELTYHQIADQMNLSPKTIDGYRDALFHKLGVKTRVSLAMYAVKHGLVKIA